MEPEYLEKGLSSKMLEIMRPGLSLRKKRFAISLRPVKYLEEVLSF